MGSLSDYAEKKLLDHLFGGGAATSSAYTAPATLYIALYVTTSPTDAGGGTEVTGGSYVRKAVTNNVANWPNASGVTATKNNGAAITFVQATASWGTIIAFGVHDDPTAGNLLMWGAINSPAGKVIGDGDTLSLPITTGFVFTMD